MNQPNFQQAQQYAYQRLAKELPADLYYHNLDHTFEDVLPAAVRLATQLGVAGLDVELIKTAAAFHDIGFLVQRENHEQHSMTIARQTLPDWGFTVPQIELVCGMIQATRLPQTPHTLWEQIVADADLDVLGRDDFFIINEALYRELGEYEQSVTLDKWYEQQLGFLVAHRYFTPAAHALRQAGKEKNITELRRRLDTMRHNKATR